MQWWVRALADGELDTERLADSQDLFYEQEEGVYVALGLQYIPPEMREDNGEIEAALEGRLPSIVEL